MECVVQAGRTVQCNGRIYEAGDVLVLPSAEAEKLAALGFVSYDEEVVVEAEVEAAPRGENENTLPGDFPGRDSLVAAGLDDMVAVFALSEEELLEIDGIGPSTADRINNYTGGDE